MKQNKNFLHVVMPTPRVGISIFTDLGHLSPKRLPERLHQGTRSSTLQVLSFYEE